ncbi:MAG: alpha/beta fold hydrolase [Burkholderiales bacterium]|nr:MAG: alpha/beta fold hydrolase [Burkholderiales bacterium]
MTTLVLLPGLDGTGLLFKPLLDAPAGAIPVAVVRFPTTAAAGYAELERCVEAAIPGEDPIVLLGESFSGPIAISLAAKYPKRVKGLVLCCTFARNPHPALGAFKPLASVLPFRALPAALSTLALLGRHATPELRRLLADALAPVSSKVLGARLAGVLSIDASASLARVVAPMLYLRATEDRLIPRSAAETIKVAQPALQVVDVPGPHGLLQAAPDAAARLVLDFFRKLA